MKVSAKSVTLYDLQRNAWMCYVQRFLSKVFRIELRTRNGPPAEPCKSTSESQVRHPILGCYTMPVCIQLTA